MVFEGKKSNNPKRGHFVKYNIKKKILKKKKKEKKKDHSKWPPTHIHTKKKKGSSL